MDPRRREPDATHPITVTPTAERVVVEVDGRVVADTTDALTLSEASYPPVQYVPLAAVDPAVLEPSAHHTYCPYKGEADYFHLATPQQTQHDAVWVYRAPYDAVAQIADHVAFYPGRATVTVG